MTYELILISDFHFLLLYLWFPLMTNPRCLFWRLGEDLLWFKKKFFFIILTDIPKKWITTLVTDLLVWYWLSPIYILIFPDGKAGCRQAPEWTRPWLNCNCNHYLLMSATSFRKLFLISVLIFNPSMCLARTKGLHILHHFFMFTFRNNNKKLSPRFCQIFPHCQQLVYLNVLLIVVSAHNFMCPHLSQNPSGHPKWAWHCLFVCEFFFKEVVRTGHDSLQTSFSVVTGLCASWWSSPGIRLDQLLLTEAEETIYS